MKNPQPNTISDNQHNKVYPAGKDLAWLVGVLMVAAFFLVLKMFTLHPYNSDEHIYIYQGKLIAEGFVPYRDFSMAHPPLQALFAASLIKIFGYHFTAFRLLATFWALMAGLFLAVIVKREWGRTASVFSMALYILAYEPLRASIHFTGVNMTLALLMVAFFYFRKQKPFLFSLFCILAVFTRYYALPAVLAMLIVWLIQDRKKFIHVAAYGATLAVLFFLVIGAWTGFPQFINDAFLFQAQKTSMQEDKLSFMRDAVLFHNAIPFVLFLLGAITLGAVSFSQQVAQKASEVARKERKLKIKKRDYTLLWTSLLAVVLTLGILLNMKRVWMYYFVLAFPFGAVLGGWMVALWVQSFRRYLPVKFNPTGSLVAVNPAWLVASAVMFVFFYLVSPRLEKRLNYYQEAMRNPEKRTSNYQWREGALPGPLNDVVKSFIWKDTRIIGETYSSFTYFLWHASRVVDVLPEIAGLVRSSSSDTDYLFGDSGTVPLVALLSGRGIAAKEVDTNLQRYKSGNASVVELIRKIDLPSTRYILLRDNFGVAALPEIGRLVREKYKEKQVFRSKTGFTLRLYERMGR